MKTIYLAADTFHVPFKDLAHLIADAQYPETGPNDGRLIFYICRSELESELKQAVKNGILPVKSPLTFGPHTFPVGNALLSAVVTVDDLRKYVAERGLSVILGAPEQAAPVQSPVEPADPERRLQSLRQLGGEAKFTKSAWKFTGISALVTSEKAQVRKRSSEKTIRADLREAAESEREAKRAGFADGLGPR